MTLCLLTMFKNEGLIMKEFITHYLTQGVDRFFMIDNGSNDNYREPLQEYIDKGIVELIIDPVKHAQVACYNKYFKQQMRAYEWTIVCDLDEFIYARKSFKTIKDYLFKVDRSVSQVIIPWKMFGSNGFDSADKPQPVSVIQSFVRRESYSSEKMINCKAIVRTAQLVRFNIHSHVTQNNVCISSTGTDESISKNQEDHWFAFAKINDSILENSCLHLNHYQLQSFDWFMRIKATRGDNTSKVCDTVRNEDYFRSVNATANEVIDLELFEISNGIL